MTSGELIETAAPKPPGLWAGVLSVFAGFAFVAKSPRIWPAAALPAAILLTLSAACVALAIFVLRPSLEAWLQPSAAWYAQLGSALAAWLVALLASILGIIVALAATPPLSGPALERIVGAREEALGIPPRAPMSFLSEMWCGLRAQAFAAMFAIPLLALLWVAELLLPPLAVVTVPAKFVVAAFSLAWNLFDYPLTLRGARMRYRFNLVLANKRAVLGFGLTFALLFWLPCFQVLMLPVGVAAATHLVWQILEADPNLLPELPRARRPDATPVDPIS